MKNKKIIITLAIVLIILVSIIVTISVVKGNIIIKAENNKKEEKQEIDTAIEREATFDFSSANQDEISNLFYSFAIPKTKNGNWDSTKGIPIEHLRNSLKNLENSNSFANIVARQFEIIKFDSLSNIEKDYLDLYLKLLFENLNASFLIEGDGTILNDFSIPSQLDLGTLEKVRVRTGDSEDVRNTQMVIKYRNNKVLNQKSEYSWITFTKTVHLNDMSGGTEILLYDSEFDPQNKQNFSEYSIDKLNEVISKSSQLIDLLIGYRDTVYLDVAKSKMKEKYDLKLKTIQEAKFNETPKIGMTKDKVKQTKWGYPNDINKYIFQWGTIEQWVYSKKGYVYFTNEVVTSIVEY